MSMNFEEFNQNLSILMGVVLRVKDICHAFCEWGRIKNCSFLIEAGLILTSEESDFLNIDELSVMYQITLWDDITFVG